MREAARHRRASGLSQSTDLREAPFSHRSVHDAPTRHRRDPLLVKAEMIIRYRSVKTGQFVRLTREQFLASVSERARD